jgi:hypothetical protein
MENSRTDFRETGDEEILPEYIDTLKVFMKSDNNNRDIKQRSRHQMHIHVHLEHKSLVFVGKANISNKHRRRKETFVRCPEQSSVNLIVFELMKRNRAQSPGLVRSDLLS